MTALPSLKQFQQDWQKFEETHCPLCLAFIDIDNFKAINTEIGHDKADLVIIELSKILGELLIGRGKLYHRSGDEFLVCLQNSDGNEAKYLFDRAISIIGQHSFTALPRNISISIGIAQYEKDMPLETLSEHSNLAMKTAKEQGKGRAFVFGS